jgi:murein DD-endopeptidase MepM/ murein hydrolase activator NlpD
MHPSSVNAPKLPDAATTRGRGAHLLLLLRLLCASVVVAAPLQPAPAAAADPAAVDPAATGATPARGVWPLQPRAAVVARFDPPSSPWGRGHRGVDLAGHVGQQVHAALAGVVTFAGRLAGRGVVVVDHGATRTTYEPVGAGVQVGELVGAGEVIGRLQLFGSHCFPRACLHWGLIEGRDHYLDPLTLVGAAPVRLLPLGGRAQQGLPLLGASPLAPGTGSPVPAVAAYAATGAVLDPAMALAVQARGWAWR